MADNASKTDQIPGNASIAYIAAHMISIREHPIDESERQQAEAWLKKYERLIADARASTPSATPESYEVAARELEPVPFFGRGFPL